MPILFVHGVAVRQENESDTLAINKVLKGIDWPEIQQLLHQYIAPVLNPNNPEQVSVKQIYWGDLAEHFQARKNDVTQVAWPEHLADWPIDQLGEYLEKRLLSDIPTEKWPDLIKAVWSVVKDKAIRQLVLELPAPEQGPFLQSAIESGFSKLREEQAEQEKPSSKLRFKPKLDTTLPESLISHKIWMQGRQSAKRFFGRIRQPLEAFIPIFLGDVFAYLNHRGSLEQPGSIPQRVLEALWEAHLLKQRIGEPLIVLTHSMGGQLIYDALTAFLPAHPEYADVYVDFWCATGSQVGFFKELQLFLEGAEIPSLSVKASPHVGYFWNVWSYTDFLSFRSEGFVEGAVDTPFPFPPHLQGDHLTYISHVPFYQTLAAKIEVHTQGLSELLSNGSKH